MQIVKNSDRKSGWIPSVVATHGAIPLRLEPTDLVALLQSCLAPVADQARRCGVELRVDVPQTLARVMLDREKVGWAIVTLVGNTLRYVARAEGAGGSIIVQLSYDPTVNEVAVSVHDDGPGVPTDKLPHLFVRRPYALHADGLALSLVRDVVGAHDGRIEVESSADDDVHGTSITLHFRCG